jgi:hypothetical protein
MADTAEIVHQVETMYAAYSGAFNHGDIASVVRYISAPYVMTIGANAPIVALTADDVRRMFDANLVRMKGHGWARSDYAIVHVWPLSDGHALLMTDITRFRPDGSVLETGRYCYSARRAEPMWQITGVTDVAPPFLGPGDFPRA